jgi:hypothetical protein
LTEQNSTVEEVFKPINGMITSEEFINGLEALSIEKFEKSEFFALMDFLQHPEEEDEMIVDYDLFRKEIDQILNLHISPHKPHKSLNDISILRKDRT